MKDKDWDFLQVIGLSIVSVLFAFLIVLTASMENAPIIVFASYSFIIIISSIIYFLPNLKNLILGKPDPKTNPSSYVLIGLNSERPRARKISLETRVRKPKI